MAEKGKQSVLMKIYVFVIWLGLSIVAGRVQAQFISAQLDLAGLTCSLCSNSVEKSIRQLDFVENISIDLNSNLSEVVFKPGKKADISALAQKVYDAGFSVLSLTATFDFSQQAMDDTGFAFANDRYIFVHNKQTFMNGKVRLRFIGPKFLSRKEYKSWEKKLSQPADDRKFAHTYFVTL